MKVRGVICLTAVAGMLGLAGWGGAGLFGWTSEEADDAGQVIALAAEPDAAALEETSPTLSAETKADRAQDQVAGIFGWDPSLLNPQRLSGARAIVTPAPAVSAAPAASTAPAATTAQPVQAEAPAPAPVARAPEPRSRERHLVQSAAAAVQARLKRDNFDGRLTIGQIAQIKHRLRLSAEQEEYWKPVEAMLVGMVKKQARAGGKVALTAVEMQNLYWTAGPLVMRLRDDQKQEARNLARAMGLETVASQI